MKFFSYLLITSLDISFSLLFSPLPPHGALDLSLRVPLGLLLDALRDPDVPFLSLLPAHCEFVLLTALDNMDREPGSDELKR